MLRAMPPSARPRLHALVSIFVLVVAAPALAATEPFAPVPIGADLSSLPANEQQALAKLVRAAQLMDTLFLRQAWAGNEPMLLALLADATPAGRARLRQFLVNKGPWDRLDHNKPFIPGAPPKPPQANFYPIDASKADLEAWMKALPAAERARAQGFYTEVRRGTDGKFMLVPYSVAFANELADARRLLEEAAALTTQPTLKTFLHKRAAAFLSNDYYDSDVAWMNLDASIEPTLGPYETYEDEWLGDKAAFEAFITVRDEAESKKLEKFAAELQDIENHLPIDGKLRNPKLGALAPIRVVNEIFCSGDANHGVQTAAYNLPNDERIAKEKGTKRVMLKNVQEAKFKVVLTPIAKVALTPADQKNVAFDAFFTHILMHELMHGLGPHNITVAGRATTPRQELQETGSAIEEAKADVSGLFALQYLVDKGVVDKAMERVLYTTYLAQMFRSIRFGVAEAHGKGTALQLNRFLDAGAVVVKGGVFTVDAAKFKPAVVELTRDLLMLEANGDAAGARALLAKMGVVRPEVQKILDKLARVPVDIEPKFVTADKLLQQSR
ncbi:MAG: mismatch repair protein MutT [Myxococcales bacterium]|nr:mismatch repair protein MutT [Myxococcales bacterium]